MNWRLRLFCNNHGNINGITAYMASVGAFDIASGYEMPPTGASRQYSDPDLMCEDAAERRHLLRNFPLTTEET